MNWHPYAESFDLLEGKAYEEFRADIASSNGPREPIKFRLIDGGIKQGLDGRNRLRACDDLEIPCPEQLVEVDDESVEAFIDSLNVHRRHLSREQQQEKRAERVKRVTEKRAQGQSTREIADSEGVSQSTIQRDLEKSGEPGGSPENEKPADPPKTTGKDGKKYPAKTKKLCASCEHRAEVGKPKIDKCPDCKALNAKPKKEKPKPPDVPNEREPGEEVEQVTDAVGFVVPFKAIQAFEDAGAIGKICKDIDGIISRVEAAGKSPGGKMLHTTSQMQTLQQVRKSLWAGRATHVCPYCKGEGKCEPCKNSGWLDKVSWKNAPEGLRKEMEVAK